MGRDTIWSLRTGPQGPMYFLQVDLIACLLLPPYDAIVVGAHQGVNLFIRPEPT